MARRGSKFDPSEFIAELSSRLKEESRHPNNKKYKPHEKQHIFHSSKKKKKLYIGGNRSGKTTGGVNEGIWRATQTHPYRPELNLRPSSGRVIGVDFTNGIDKIIIPQYKQWLYPSAIRGGAWETAYDKSLRTLNFESGSTIEFMSYDQDLDKFAGVPRDWVHFDEEPPKSIYTENMARLIDLDGEFWMTMTPVEGMTWIYEDLYEENVDNADGDVLVVEINTLENPYLSSGAVASFIKSIDGDDAATRIGGKFIQMGGRVYKNFDPTPGAVQVLPTSIDLSEPKKLFPEREWLWLISLDHGLNNPTAVYWSAVDRNGFIVTFKEHYMREWTVEQHAEVINKVNREFGRRPDIWVADPSVVNRNAITNTSVVDEYQKYGISWQPGNNDVRSGIIRMKRYFNPAPLVGKKNDHPLFVPELAANFKTRKPNEPLKFARLRFNPECSAVIKELKKYRWKTYANKKLQYENNAYDEPHKKDDHGCDSLRYMLMSQPDLAAQNDDLMQKVNEALGGINFGNSGFADPNNLLDETRIASTGWAPSVGVPTSGDWQYDEHMGADF